MADPHGKTPYLEPQVDSDDTAPRAPDESPLERVLSLIDERTLDQDDDPRPQLAQHPAAQPSTATRPSSQLRVGFVQSRQGMTAQVTLLGADR
ncbi:MAG TPA: hypothetical protein VN764_10745, partial [Polyangiaceae bacterium]|nr:hypothetical protein [Polyangiaceae bacterium]